MKTNIDQELSMPWGGYDFKKKTLAAIAAGDAGCCTIFSAGPHIKMQQQEYGLSLEDLDIKPPAAGIWIWEGSGVWSPGPWEHPDDGDYELVGTWRKPTEDEWLCIKNNQCPWNDDDWLHPAWKEEIISENFENKFETTVNQWHKETDFFSDYEGIYSNPNFLKIIGFGEKAIPLIIKSLKIEPSWLFVALEYITGENPVPHTEEYAGKLYKQIDCWIKWAEDKGIS